MAYFLRFDANSGNYVSNPSVTLSDSFRIDIDMEIRSFPTIQKLFDGDGNPTNERLDITLREAGADNRNYCHFLADGQPAGVLSSFLNKRFVLSLVRDDTDSDQSIKEFSFIGCRFNQQRGQFLDADVYSVRVYDSSGTLVHNFSPSASNGTGQLIDTKGGNHGTPNGFADFEAALIYYDDGSSEPEPETEIHEFSGSTLVNASASALAYKAASLAGNAQVSALSQSSLSKLTEFSGQATVNVSSVSLFEKVTTFTGAATVDATSQSAFSKRVSFSGESTVNVTASGVLFDENVEIHTFAGGATISVSASGQAIKVGLVSGESRVDATTTAQAQKVAALSGNAQVNASTQSAFSKLATLAGNAITRITTAATITKRVLLNGASTVLARASGTFFNTDSNVETYETTIQGRVKAPLVVQGTVKSITIQGRVK